ncbi:hypothetical protein LTS17_009237 [Exophiala oligosperma]
MSDINPTSPPFEVASPNDRGVSVSIVNVILIIFTGIVVISRAITRLTITRLTALDDLAIFAALAFSIIQCIFVQISRNHGLGKHRDKLSSHQFFEYSRFNYAGQLLTIFTLICAKLAVSRLILTIRPKQPVRLATYATEGIAILWAVTSIFALAFQCDVPNPWIQGPGRCVNLKGLYYYVGIFNLLTDLALVILPVFVVSGLQLKMSKKLFVFSLFATRIITVGVIIAELATLNPYLDAVKSQNGDQTFEIAIPTLLNQIMIFASVVTACVPSLRRVVTELQTRQTGLHVDRALELAYGSGKYGNGTVPTAKGSSSGSHHGGGGGGNTSSNVVNGGSSNNNGIPYGHNIHAPIGNMASIYTSHNREKTTADHSRPSSQEHLRQDGNIHYTQEYSVATLDDETRSTPSERRQESELN